MVARARRRPGEPERRTSSSNIRCWTRGSRYPEVRPISWPWRQSASVRAAVNAAMAPSVSPVRSSAGNRSRNAQRQASSRARPGWRANAAGSRSTASTSVAAAYSRSRGRGGRVVRRVMVRSWRLRLAPNVRALSAACHRFSTAAPCRDRDTTMTRRGRGGDTAGRQWMGLTGGRVTERAVKLGGVSRVLLIEDDPAVREGLELGPDPAWSPGARGGVRRAGAGPAACRTLPTSSCST